MTRRVSFIGSILSFLVLVTMIQAQTAADADFDGSGTVNFADFIEFAAAFGSSQARYDLDGNGTVDFPDFVAFAQFFGHTIPSTTIVVNSSEDSGESTLRQALLDATPQDVITFDPAIFPPDAPDTISLVNPLPGLSQGHLTIDASDVGVVIDGSMISESEASGISIYSNNNVIRGLHIRNFSFAGIALFGAQDNIIGGDRNKGDGLSGQGNMITGTGTFGIGLWGEETSYNTIQGNIIGTDVSGTVRLGSFSGGVFSDGAHYNLIVDNLIGGYVDNGVHIGSVSDGHNTVRGNHIGTDTSGVIQIAYSSSNGVSIGNSGSNVVGPSNVIAHNGLSGITIQGDESVGNRITRNSIHDNDKVGIELYDGGNVQLAAPAIFDFDLQAGTVTGVACANCTVEVFSDSIDEGEVYEGHTTADNSGLFTFSKGASFTRSRLTATATDENGNTSRFSVFTPDIPSRTVILQEGNNLIKARFQPKHSGDLADNRISGGWDLPWILDLGVKRAAISLSEAEWPIVRWDIPEFEVPLWLDNYVNTLVANGMILNDLLPFWDKANHPGGEGWPAVEGRQPEDGYSRFQTEEEIERYLEFVQFNVRHFKGRVQYYELWNEPNNGNVPVQYIKVPDYINLVKRVVPVIRQEDPEAKIVVGSVVLQYDQDYFFELLRSEEIMPLVDVLNWHALFSRSPASELQEDREYYYDYPSIVQAIKDTASAHGFEGEYYAEAGWASPQFTGTPDQTLHTKIQAAKYYARTIVRHLGMDVWIELGEPVPERVIVFATIQNLCTVMAGNRPDSMAVEIESAATNIRSYGFSLPDGDKLFALWTDGMAVDSDAGVSATLVFSSLSAEKAVGIDVLNGFEEELIVETGNGDLVIRNLLVKDYPVIIRLTD